MRFPKEFYADNMYAITIVITKREDYDEDKLRLLRLMKRIIDYCKGCEVGHLGYEVSKVGKYLHIHTHMTSDIYPFIKKIFPKKTEIKGVSFRIKKLHTPEDIDIWVDYCHKGDDIQESKLRAEYNMLSIYSDAYDAVKRSDVKRGCHQSPESKTSSDVFALGRD